MGQRYTYSIKRVKNIVVVLHVYGAIAIFLLFFDHQDTGGTGPGEARQRWVYSRKP